MNIKKILKNAVYLLMGNMGIRIITAVTIILLARYSSPKEYGAFAIAIAVSTVAGYFSDAGISNTFIREAVKKTANMEVLLGNYLVLRILFGIIASVITFVFVHSFYTNQHLIDIINWIVYPTIFGTTLTGVSTTFFQAKEKMGLSSLMIVIQGIAYSCAIGYGMLAKMSILSISILYGIAFIITGVFSLVFVLFFSKIRRGWNSAILNQLLAFTVNGIIIMTLPQLGPILLSKVIPLSDVAYFSTAYKFPSVLYQIPGVVAVAFYPKLFKLGNNKELNNKHRSLSLVELKIMSFLGIAISIPFIVSPNFWIISLLGQNYASAGPALEILAYIVILQSISYPVADYITTKGEPYKRTLVLIISFVIAICSYMLLGKEYGYMGGAIASIIVELGLLVGYSIMMKRGLLFILNGIKFNVLSFLVTLVIAKFIPNFNSIIYMTISVLCYMLFVLILDRKMFIEIKTFVQEKFRSKGENHS
ncbi:oligosaccharide flippase family protein [Sporolactobacillus sp. STSJ-5]|uniref:oligosaccharide flippase family protein n=1 Tax=Sporolactobacillus sp. STSJ-5 TaxID=2965076 RepID=UPI002107548D|nr:oligosaccharide flippase family protein [Sporolactobacillus sp. STSJ-5]MCQ2009544.1 oligosaccharide flippase family protein [Sporolactobacillus sp. STSJ-5]